MKVTFSTFLVVVCCLHHSMTARAYAPLNGVTVKTVAESKEVDIGKWLKNGNDRKMVIFGTYAADFNSIEYGQRLRYYWPLLQEKGVNKCAFLLNCQPSAAKFLKAQLDLQDSVELWYDNNGEAGRKFGVEQGWLKENDSVNPFLKLFGMLFGLGAWATLPAVIGGYIGNPFVPQPWIRDAMQVGVDQGRWPDNALEQNPDGTVTYKFDELPLVGSWKRRPLELATLRLQSMLGISLKYKDELFPDQDALESGVLTQLGGCILIDSDGTPIFEWRDPGICAVANFEDILKKLET